jgi:hypothetical protein
MTQLLRSGTEAGDQPMFAFSDALRDRLARGKYSRWAKDLTEESVEALIWAIGEYASRQNSDVLFPDQPPRIPHFTDDPVADARMRVGLTCITRIYRGEPLVWETVNQAIREAVNACYRQGGHSQ